MSLFRAGIELNDGVDFNAKVDPDKEIGHAVKVSFNKNEPVYLSISSVNLIIAVLMAAVDAIEEDES